MPHLTLQTEMGCLGKVVLRYGECSHRTASSPAPAGSWCYQRLHILLQGVHYHLDPDKKSRGHRDIPALWSVEWNLHIVHFHYFLVQNDWRKHIIFKTVSYFGVYYRVCVCGRGRGRGMRFLKGAIHCNSSKWQSSWRNFPLNQLRLLAQAGLNAGDKQRCRNTLMR